MHDASLFCRVFCLEKDYCCCIVRLGQTHISCSGLQEVAVMYNAVRKVTVMSLTDIDLLVLDRDDYTNIFMHAEKDKEPRHIAFLRTLKNLDGFPFHLLPYNDPDTCMTTYFRSVSHLTHRTRYTVYFTSGLCCTLPTLPDTPYILLPVCVAHYLPYTIHRIFYFRSLS